MHSRSSLVSSSVSPLFASCRMAKGGCNRFHKKERAEGLPKVATVATNEESSLVEEEGCADSGASRANLQSKEVQMYKIGG